MANPVIHGNSLVHTVLDTQTALTGSYVAGTDLTSVDGASQLMLLVDYTRGDETNMDIKVEFYWEGLAEGADLHQLTYGDIGTSATAINLNILEYSVTAKTAFPLDNMGGRVKISWKATGGTPTGTINGIKLVYGKD